MNEAESRTVNYRWYATGAALVLVVGVAGLYQWLASRATPAVTVAKPTPPQFIQPPTVEPPRIRFTDITAEANIDFVHENGSTGHKLLPETMGSGCAFLDYDNDGDQDLLLVNSCYWPGEGPPDSTPTMAFYENDGTGRFTNVTEQVGLAVCFYGMGAAVADYNKDGFVDIFITGVGGNHLFRNESGKKFTDVTSQAGVAGVADWPNQTEKFLEHEEPINWSTSAAWLDYDRDGHLDLFVCNYIRWSPKIDVEQEFQLVGIGRAFGPPTNFAGANNFLYRNRGNGTFEDVSTSAGIHVFSSTQPPVPVGKALAVLATDVDEDGWIDLVVANDTVENFFFHNQGDGTFEERAKPVGLAFDPGGMATGAMGIDGGQPRNDGMLAIPIGNFSNEMTSFYVRQPASMLMMYDEARSAGIGAPTRQSLTFGVLFLDFDLDGRLDLLTANGHLEEEINKHQPGQHYEQPPQLFWNAGPDQRMDFVLLTEEQVGPDILRPMVGRGLACADIDGDGDQDVLITVNGGAPRLLRNEAIASSPPPDRHWVRLELVGARASHTPIGARVELRAGEGQMVQRRELAGGRSYLCQAELALTFGLGPHRRIDELRIFWPGSDEPQVLTDLSADRTYRIIQDKPISDGE